MWNIFLRRFCNRPLQQPNSLFHTKKYCRIEISTKKLIFSFVDRVYSCQSRLLENVAESSQLQKTPNKPFYAQILVNRVLYKSEDRSCLHIELNIENSGLNYEAGDHVAIYPTNESSLVFKFAELCKVKLDKDIADILLYNVDITAIPTQCCLQELSKFCLDHKDKDFLQSLGKSKEKYENWVIEDRRNIMHILKDMKSCRARLSDLYALLPRMQPRFYSISSSSKLHANCVHITAVIVKKGLASTFLQSMSKHPSAKVPIYIAKSNFHLIDNAAVPIIMVAAGTGLAPFRGFIQDRQFMRDAGKKVADTLLYFGCRKRHEDFIYGEELLEFVKKGTLTLRTAFSRDQHDKLYVTHLLEKDADLIWQLINEKKAYFYICGDAKNMATDVRNTLLKIISKKGNLSAELALQYLSEMQVQKRYSADVWG